jgi:hypothetical protein
LSNSCSNCPFDTFFFARYTLILLTLASDALRLKVAGTNLARKLKPQNLHSIQPEEVRKILAIRNRR